MQVHSPSFLAEHLHVADAEGPDLGAVLPPPPEACVVAPGCFSNTHPQAPPSWGLTPQLHSASQIHWLVFVAVQLQVFERAEGERAGVMSFPGETADVAAKFSAVERVQFRFPIGWSSS